MRISVSPSVLKTISLIVFSLVFLVVAGIILLSDLTAITKYFSLLILAIIVLICLVVYYARLVKFSGRIEYKDVAEEQSLFVELYQNSPVPYIRTKQDGTILFANSAAVRLFGETESVLQTKNVFSAIHGEGENAEHVALIPRLVSTGTFINNQEVQLLRADGVIFWVMLSAFPYANQTETLITLVDITKQKNVDTAKSEFVSLASHQLRTPLSAIKWNLELLASPRIGDLNDAQKEYVNKLSRSAERMALLIKDFLDASQLEMGTFATEVTEISLSPFLDEQLEEFEARVATKQLTIERNYPPESIVFQTDAHLLRMSTNNLISNAVKYTEEGGSVNISYEVTAKTIDIKVKDTGLGVPAADQAHLFSKFFRAGNVKPTTIEGTGIGLYIVKQAVEMMSGTISFTSTEGVGTEFVISLPKQL